MSDKLLHLEKLFNELVRFPRALLVDDDESALLCAEIMFHRAGFLTSSANNSKDAMGLARRGGYDLIVTDLKMGGNNGSSFVRFCWREVPGSKVSILTGYPKSDEIYHLIEERPITILAKPVNLDMVIGLMNDFNITSPFFYGWRHDANSGPPQPEPELVGHQ